MADLGGSTARARVEASRPRKGRALGPSVLLTGFDPFGGDAVNPSWEAVRRLRGETIARHRVVAVQVPTDFARCGAVLAAALKRHRPALVIAVGQAGGRAAISIERAALNVIDARIADNAGAQPIDVPVIAGAPAAYFSTLPIKAMVAALRAHDIPAEVSNSAGTFVCNALAFALSHALALQGDGVRGGFIHIPYLPRQVLAKPGVACLPVSTVIDALRICVRTALTTREDVRHGEGRDH